MASESKSLERPPISHRAGRDRRGEVVEATTSPATFGSGRLSTDDQPSEAFRHKMPSQHQRTTVASTKRRDRARHAAGGMPANARTRKTPRSPSTALVIVRAGAHTARTMRRGLAICGNRSQFSKQERFHSPSTARTSSPGPAGNGVIDRMKRREARPHCFPAPLEDHPGAAVGGGPGWHISTPLSARNAERIGQRKTRSAPATGQHQRLRRPDAVVEIAIRAVGPPTSTCAAAARGSWVPHQVMVSRAPSSGSTRHRPANRSKGHRKRR